MSPLSELQLELQHRTVGRVAAGNPGHATTCTKPDLVSDSEPQDRELRSIQITPCFARTANLLPVSHGRAPLRPSIETQVFS